MPFYASCSNYTAAQRFDKCRRCWQAHKDELNFVLDTSDGACCLGQVQEFGFFQVRYQEAFQCERRRYSFRDANALAAIGSHCSESMPRLAHLVVAQSQKKKKRAANEAPGEQPKKKKKGADKSL